MGRPGCPELALLTASMDRNRMALTAKSSSSLVDVLVFSIVAAACTLRWLALPAERREKGRAASALHGTFTPTRLTDRCAIWGVTIAIGAEAQHFNVVSMLAEC